MKIGHISLTDPAMPAAKQDYLRLEVEKVIAAFFMEPSQFVSVSVSGNPEELRLALIRLCDEEKCPLVMTTGGSGPTANDFTPDTTRQVLDRDLPGFGEIMRYYSYERFKVAVLSRATAGVRGKSLIINFPGRPKPIKFCLKLLQEGIAEALYQINGTTTELRGDEIALPLDKYLPFLKWLRPKGNPDEAYHQPMK